MGAMNNLKDFFELMPECYYKNGDKIAEEIFFAFILYALFPEKFNDSLEKWREENGLDK